MKIYFSLFFSCFFLLMTCAAFAGTTSLTTYYPPPAAAYNKIKLSTNATTYNANPTTYCATQNPPGTYVNNGALFVDAKGTLNVCMGGKAIVYPQECYNKFCSYDTSAVPLTPCTVTCGTGTGFTQTPLDATGNLSETFKTSATTMVISIVCCSGT